MGKKKHTAKKPGMSKKGSVPEFKPLSETGGWSMT